MKKIIPYLSYKKKMRLYRRVIAAYFSISFKYCPFRLREKSFKWLKKWYYQVLMRTYFEVQWRTYFRKMEVKNGKI